MRFVPLLLLAACATEPTDIKGPFTGPTTRFVVDSIDLPTTIAMAREYADDLDGNGTPDNQLGTVFGQLAAYDNLTTHGKDMIASGAIASSVEIVADNFTDDSTVSVLYRGADGEVAVAVGGTMKDGKFESNRTVWTEVPGSTTLHLPVFADADPSVIELSGMEIDLVSDLHGGFEGWVRGVLDPDEAKHVAYLGAAQMLAANPGAHMTFLKIFDAAPQDYRLSEEEFTKSSLILSLFSPDVVFESHKKLSFAFHVHLSPCESGRCASTIVDSCHDRVRDRYETDIDCGGIACGRCPEAGHCVEASDCASHECDGGVCKTASCTNGVRDGFETDIDCGGNCGACLVGAQCFSDHDCGAGHTCGPPCTDSICYDQYDRCQ
jgi:hypothetical protein